MSKIFAKKMPALTTYIFPDESIDIIHYFNQRQKTELVRGGYEAELGIWTGKKITTAVANR
jgi:hypothetical protein